MPSVRRDIALRYLAAGLRPPSRLAVVPSPVVAVIAGSLAAGIWQILRLAAHPLRPRITAWLVEPAVSPGPVEQAVRAATAGARARAVPGSASFIGPYPTLWTEEDKMVWEATSGVTCQAAAGLSHDRRTGDDAGSAALPALRRRVMAMIDRTAWDGPENLPGERDYTVDLVERPILLGRLFGDRAEMGRRLIRLASRMLANGAATGVLSPAQPGLLHPDFALISDIPVHLSLDDRGRPHASDGPYCRWADGSGLYAVHGIPVPAHLFECPETLTVQVIEQQRNAEVRRVLIERYGPGRFLRDSEARVIDRDPRFGTLYRKDMAGDEPTAMIAVTNATPEADGTRNEYFLRVPPDMPSARAAVAWTFGLEAHEYSPLTET